MQCTAVYEFYALSVVDVNCAVKRNCRKTTISRIIIIKRYKFHYMDGIGCKICFEHDCTVEWTLIISS